jgi:Bacterial membrane protein YfhO
MRGWPSVVLVASSVVALTLACHGDALLRGEQYAYRDAAHYYYPLHQRVQQEWSGGRWPLWDPTENAGMPLMGNPTAAVLYPGKLIFAAFPYPLAARLYVVVHTLLAFGTMFALARSWGTGTVGSSLGGLAYAFGVPVLFQYSNVIYLVGAAWAPLGMLFADRWVRLGDRRAIPALGMVLAMETLGGDLETAYLTGFFAAGYATCRVIGRWSRWIGPGVVVVGVAWTLAALFIASRSASWRPPPTGDLVVSPLPWMRWVGLVVAGGWVLAGLLILDRWRRARMAGRPAYLGPTLAGLAASAILAGSLSAAQLLPVLEFAGQSGRFRGQESLQIYPFSLDPVRLIEFAWPNASGTIFDGNHSWLEAANPTGKSSKAWVPSLYMGGLTLGLALAMAGIKGGPDWRAWIAVVGLFSLLASFGEYASPIFLARHSGRLAETIGGLDPTDGPAIRLDGRLRDGDGGPYWTLATLLPGFKSFRYPSKFLTFTAIALAALAAQGWDALASGDPRFRRRLMGWSAALLGLTLVAIVAASMVGRGYISGLADRPREALGPLQAEAAYRDLRQGLIHGALALGAVLGMAAWPGRGRGWTVLGVALMVVDLSLANSGQVLTLPQRSFEGPVKVLEVIERSERDRPSVGPFRVYRMPNWQPSAWSNETSAERNSKFLEWERGTLQPKYGIPSGIQYTMVLGVAELHDHEAFFRPYSGVASPRMASSLGVPVDQEILFYRRRAFDLWNTRYFILPFYAGKWNRSNRAFSSFLARTEPVYPAADAFRGEAGRRERREWIESADFQVRRNLAENPRAWIVHRAIPLRPDFGLEDMLFSEDDSWADPDRIVQDPKSVAWLDRDQINALRPFLAGRPPTQPEAVRVASYESDRVELKATLNRPGLVILADVDYPGWTLTIDGQDASIHRANRIMRAAALSPGEHTLIFKYRPLSFRIGLIITGLTLTASILAGFIAAWRSRKAAIVG